LSLRAANFDLTPVAGLPRDALVPDPTGRSIPGPTGAAPVAHRQAKK
jgi:hypothetical protein